MRPPAGAHFNETIDLTLKAPPTSKRAARRAALGWRSAPLRVVFEDDEVVVIDKPAGLLTVATSTERERTAIAQLARRLEARRPPQRIFVVHRLDREASGLLVFAKTEAAKHHLQAQFRAHTAGRVYMAAVIGSVSGEGGTLRSWLAQNRAHTMYETTRERGGELAITHYRVVRREPGCTWLEVRLETGRKHQIRAQLAALGHPLVGDRRYGERRQPGLRMALHAMRLAFKHPRDDRPVEFDSPLPTPFPGRTPPPKSKLGLPAPTRGAAVPVRPRKTKKTRTARAVAPGRPAAKPIKKKRSRRP